MYLEMKDLSKMYFAKMNVNEDIYEVYNDKRELTKLLVLIFEGITPKPDFYDEKGGRTKFFDLNISSEGMKVTGRLGYIKPGVHSSYDPETDSAIDTKDNNKIEYITFYFDVDEEMLAYVVNPILGRKKVPESFAKLIKKGSGIGVEFSIEANVNTIRADIKRYERIGKLHVKLLPPNGDKDDFNKLMGLTLEDVEESNATKVNQEFQTQRKAGINPNSKLVQNFIDGAGLGYAEISLTGKDQHGENLELNSSENAPFTRSVDSDKTKNINTITDIGKAGIYDIDKYRTKLRLKKLGKINKK